MQENSCNQCGASLDPDSVFCQQCGAKVITTGMEQEMSAAGEVRQEIPAAIQAEEAAVKGPAAEPIDPMRQAAIQAQYPQQTPYGQAPYGQTPYGQAQPKKRWWLPVVIVLLLAAVIAGIWFFFIRGNVFASDTEAWHAAEEEAFNSEDSLFGSWRSSANKFIESGKTGSGAELSLILDQLPGMSGSPEEEAIIESIRNINLKIEYKMDVSLDSPHLSFLAALAKKDADEDAVSLNFYTVGEDLVISIPQLFDKPLVLTKDAMDEMMENNLGSLGGTGSDTLFGSLKGLQENLTILSDEKFDAIFADLREIFYRYAGDPERIKDTQLAVGSITEELDVFVATVPAEEFPEFFKDILTYVRDNPDIRSFITGMTAGLSEDLDDSPLSSFDEEINYLIEDIDAYPENYQLEVKRQLYVDAGNKPQADSLTLTNYSEDNEEVHYESLLAKDGDQRACSFKFSFPGDNSFEFASEFTEKDGLSTGDFEIIVFENGVQLQEVDLKGTFTDFGIDTEGDNFSPVGEINFLAAGMSGDDTDVSALEVSYTGTVEAKDGVDHLMARLLIKTDMEGSPLEIGFNADMYPIPEGEIVFDTLLPADYIDLSDEEALNNLMSDDTLFIKLLGILSNLGIDPALFMN